jgi:hypothetical protein
MIAEGERENEKGSQHQRVTLRTQDPGVTQRKERCDQESMQRVNLRDDCLGPHRLAESEHQRKGKGDQVW